jgi:hypothetical protein
MSTVPRVAPYQSCVACFKGDVNTGFAALGEAEFVMAAMHKMAGLTIEEASATFGALAVQKMGCDPGMVPSGRQNVIIRLCRECAGKMGTPVGDLNSDLVPGYEQSEEES